MGHSRWLHEIKQDGFRVIARKVGERVKLYSRPGNDLTRRFPLIVQAVAKLRASSCIIDGEGVACGEDGISNSHEIIITCKYAPAASVSWVSRESACLEDDH
jgi:ATP-dependent DNA ligase